MKDLCVRYWIFCKGSRASWENSGLKNSRTTWNLTSSFKSRGSPLMGLLSFLGLDFEEINGRMAGKMVSVSGGRQGVPEAALEGLSEDGLT